MCYLIFWCGGPYWEKLCMMSCHTQDRQLTKGNLGWQANIFLHSIALKATFVLN